MAKPEAEEQEDWSIELKSEFDGYRKREKVILMQLPTGLTERGLYNLCQQYGKIEKLFWPTDKPFAFVTFSSTAEADTIVRRFKHDNEDLKDIIVEFAKEREIDKEIKPPSEENEFSSLFVKQALVDNDETPLRNVLQMDQRKIKGPFLDPNDILPRESLIRTSDYRILYLKFADPTKEFLWNSYDEVNIDFVTKNQRKIVHGRAVLISKFEVTDDISNTPKTPFSFESDLLPPKNVCTTCGRLADKMCKNCEEAQCSLECHAAKNKKQSNEAIDAKTATSSFPKPVKAEDLQRFVKITAVLNHRMVFVRPAEDHHEVAFARLMCDTVKCAKDADNLKSRPSVGTLVLAKFDYYQRALVLRNYNDTKVVVAFIDFGNVEVRDFHELKVMPDELKKKKRFARRITLAKIENDIMNEKALLYLYNLMAFGTELIIKMTPNGESNAAELMASDKWVNSMVQITNIDNIVRPRIHSVVEVMYFTDFWAKHGKRTDSKQMIGKEVIILDNSLLMLSELTFIEENDMKLFQHNDRRIQNVCNYLYNEDECYTPQNEECCVVKRNDRWYRAFCMEVCFDGFVTFQFLDYGNMQLIEVNDIRPFPEALLFDCYAITANCLSDYGVDKMTPEKVDELRNQFKPKSQWKIQRMEERLQTHLYNESMDLFVWLQKSN